MVIPARPAAHILPRMVSTFYSERDRRVIFRGRLALALAGRRADRCRNRRCARLRHCLALTTEGSRETSACPVMNAAEADAVRRASGRIAESLRPWFKAQDPRAEAFFKSVPKAKRQQVIDAFRAEEERRAAGRPRWKPYHFDILWSEPAEDRIDVPTDIAAKETKLIADAIANGCLCASEGMQANCERCGAM